MGPEELEINWTGYDGRVIDYYMHENGEWIEKQRPDFWYKHLKLENLKIHHEDSNNTYGNVAGSAVSLKESASMKVPSYGGSFMDPESGILFVYVTNEEDGRKILEMVNGTKVVLLEGKYSYEQLVDWEDKLLHKIEAEENSSIASRWTMMAPSDKLNKIRIGLSSVDDEAINEIESMLKELNIPPGAVVIEKFGKIQLDISRSDRIRPLIGGIQIDNPNYGEFGEGDCTLGFIATRNGVSGFVTAGHCGNENHPIYQPLYTGDDYTNLVGIVTDDQQGSRSSDSMWVEIYDSSYDFEIYNQYDPSNHYPVFSGMQSQSTGMYVCQGGFETGEACGEIAEVNVDVTHPEYGTLYDQVLATYNRAGGDSGAPIYYEPLDSWIRDYCVDTYGVTCQDIYGIHFGYNGTVNRAIYSPISGIETDLGELDTDG